MTKVLICGSRDFVDVGAIEKVINKLSPGDTVISGAARGADSIADSLAVDRGDLISIVIAADWDRLGKRAGFVRNIEMLEKKPDIVYAFPLGESRGTRHTIREAEKRNIPVIIYGENNG